MKHFIFQFCCNEHCALFLVSILPSSSETWLWSALPRLSAPYCHCASMLWETCQPCLDQDPGYVESVWWDSQRPGKHHTSWLKGSMHIYSAIISVTFEQFRLQYACFIRICCQCIEIWDHKIVNYYKEVYAMGQALPPHPALPHIFLQIGNFGVLNFYACEADSYETMPSVFSSV